MYVQINGGCTLPCGTFADGAIVEIAPEWLNRNVMTRLGPTLTAAQAATMAAAGTSWATMYPTLRALPLQ